MIGDPNYQCYRLTGHEYGEDGYCKVCFNPSHATYLKGLEHKHDWQKTGTVKIPTGGYRFKARFNGYGAWEGVEALVHICRDCGEIKTTSINSLEKTGE